MKIGIIGTGRLGGTLGQLFAKGMHQVMFTSKNPERLHALVDSIGKNTFFGSIEETLTFADVHLLALPFIELKNISKKVNSLCKEKVLIDATIPCNIGECILTQNGFVYSQSIDYVKHLFPEAYMARAFHSYSYKTLKENAFQVLDNHKLLMPFSCQHPDVKQILENLIRHLGYQPEFVPELYGIKKIDKQFQN